MKTLLVILLTLGSSFVAKTQNITGSWEGLLKANGTSLRFIVNVSRNGNDYYSTFDSPDQKAFGIQASKTTFNMDSLLIEMAIMKVSFKGKWDGKDAMTGAFKQGPATFDLNLKRMNDAEIIKQPILVPKPQTPKAPFPYSVENISYENADQSVHYAATLTKPNGVEIFPAVIIITGSGTQDRDGTLGMHKIYAVLGDYLTRNGIAVLRVDDRGIGGTTLGNDIDKITSEGFAKDVEAGMAYLQSRADINKKKIGLIGHSEGGMIAPMVAARRSDVAFIVLMAGPGISGEEIWDKQMEISLIRPGLNDNDHEKAAQLIRAGFAAFKKSVDYNRVKADIQVAYNTWKRNVPDSTETRLLVVKGYKPFIDWADMMKNAHALSWTNYFFNYQPAANLQKVKCPVLALNGESDMQVTYKENLAGIEAALQKGNNKHYQVKSIPNLNHMFQTCITPQDDYEKLEETFSPSALQLISDWIHTNLK
ncbi:MAG: alpha/beta hydrolase [Sediminibacterium sp.]